MGTPEGKNLEKLQTKLKELEAEKDRLVLQLRGGVIDTEEYQKQIKDLPQDIQNLKTQLASMKVPKTKELDTKDNKGNGGQDKHRAGNQARADKV